MSCERSYESPMEDLYLGKYLRLYREEGGVVHPSLTVFIVLHCTVVYTAMPPVLLSENCCIL